MRKTFEKFAAAAVVAASITNVAVPARAASDEVLARIGGRIPLEDGSITNVKGDWFTATKNGVIVTCHRNGDSGRRTEKENEMKWHTHSGRTDYRFKKGTAFADINGTFYDIRASGALQQISGIVRLSQIADIVDRTKEMCWGLSREVYSLPSPNNG